MSSVSEIESDSSLFAVFVQRCRQHPHEVALKTLGDGDELSEFTWLELEQLVAFATVCIQRASSGQLKPGDHIASWLGNGLAWVLVDLAAQAMGWVHVALDPRLPSAMATDLIDHCQARVLVANLGSLSPLLIPLPIPVLDSQQLEGCFDTLSSLGDRLDAPSLASFDADAPAQILITSGTISRPKCVVLSHRNLRSNAQAKLLAAPQERSDIRLNILPFAHAYARTCELSTWILSGCQLCIAAHWDQFLHWAPVIQPTLVNLVPHLVHRVLERFEQAGDAEHPLGQRLRLLQVGGAALGDEVWQRMARLGWPPLQGYGLTETSPVICSNRAGRQRSDTVGPPVAGVEVRIDSDGLLWTRGEHVMLGYWRDPAGTAERMNDGWFCTGDLAERLDDGSLRILGRLDDQITLSTGYKVSPLELTRRLAADPWIASVVLVGQNQPHVAALVYPNYKRLPSEYSCEAGDMSPDEALALGRAIVERLRPLTIDLPRSMQIERVAIMKQPPTIENGGLNFKGGLRRTFIEQQLCREEVAELFRR